jgi:hypothetical protein
MMWKNNKYCIFWVCVCSLRYPPCNAHAPYSHLWYTWLYNIFPHYLKNGTIFEKKFLNTKCEFWFSLQIFSETFFILRRTKRDIIINIHGSSCKLPVILAILWWNLNFLDRFSENITNTKFQENPSSTSRVIPQGRPGRKAQMTKLTAAFRNFANSTNQCVSYFFLGADSRSNRGANSREVEGQTHPSSSHRQQLNTCPHIHWFSDPRFTAAPKIWKLKK